MPGIRPATTPAPGPRFVADRVHQLWITPHGVIKAAIRNNATLQRRTQDGKSLAAVSFIQPGRFAATAFINEDYLVDRILPLHGRVVPLAELYTTAKATMPR